MCFFWLHPEVLLHSWRIKMPSQKYSICWSIYVTANNSLKSISCITAVEEVYKYHLVKSFLTCGMEEVLEWPSRVHESSEIKTQFFFSSVNTCIFLWGGKGFHTLHQIFKVVWGPWKVKAGRLQMRSKEVAPFAQSPRIILSLSRLWSPGLLTHSGFIDKKPVSTNISERHCMSCLRLANRQALLP